MAKLVHIDQKKKMLSVRRLLTSRVIARRPSQATSLRPRRELTCLYSAKQATIAKTADSAVFHQALLSSSVKISNDISEPPLPEYVPRRGEEVEVKRARLLYQSRSVHY